MAKTTYKILGIVISLGFLTSCLYKMNHNSQPKTLGLENSLFKPCPQSPNCVSTMTHSETHKIDPFAYEGLSQETAQQQLIEVIRDFPNTRIITQEEDYIHVEFRTQWMKFVDDVEFYFPENESVIHIKSASRVGYSDWGTNRKRVEALRQAYYKKQLR